MKLTNKHKSLIKSILLIAIKYFNENKYPVPKLQDKFIIKIQEILTSDKRSNAEQGLYWAHLKFIGENIPDKYLRLFDIENISDKMVHELFKSKFKITSTAFNNLSQDDFNIYHKKCIEWVSMFFWKMTVKKFKVWFGDVK